MRWNDSRGLWEVICWADYRARIGSSARRIWFVFYQKQAIVRACSGVNDFDFRVPLVGSIWIVRIPVVRNLVGKRLRGIDDELGYSLTGNSDFDAASHSTVIGLLKLLDNLINGQSQHP